MGLYKYSPEILRLAGTTDAIQKAKDSQMEKFRERYNIDASMQTRAQAVAEWSRSEKTGADLYRLLLQQSATVNKNNQILGNTGAWDNVIKQLTAEGVALGDPTYADTIGNLPIPNDLAARMGIKQGTTFKEQWPGRFNKLKSSIKAGHVAAVEAELTFQKSAGKDLEVEFITLARTRPLSADEVNLFKRKFGELGLTIPSSVSKYETVSDRNQREDEDAIKTLIASQNGYISHDDLNSFHPEAALPHRETATRLSLIHI